MIVVPPLVVLTSTALPAPAPDGARVLSEAIAAALELGGLCVVQLPRDATVLGLSEGQWQVLREPLEFEEDALDAGPPKRPRTLGP